MNSLVALPIAAAVPVASPAMSSAPATDPTILNPDAEIIGAGEKFETLLGKYVSARSEWVKLSRAARAEAEAKFGDDRKSDAWSKPLPGTSPAVAFLFQVHERNGCGRASAAVDVLYTEMEPLADLIRDSATETIAGLRAKTLVSILDCMPDLASGGRFYFENEMSHWSLFCGAIAVTGLSDMVFAIEAGFQIDEDVTQGGEA